MRKKKRGKPLKRKVKVVENRQCVSEASAVSFTKEMSELNDQISKLCTADIASNHNSSAQNIPSVEKIVQTGGAGQGEMSVLNSLMSKLCTAEIISNPKISAKKIPSVEKIIQKDGTGQGEMSELNDQISKLCTADIASNHNSFAQNIPSVEKIVQTGGAGQGVMSELNDHISKLCTADIASYPNSFPQNIPSVEKIVQTGGAGQGLRRLLNYRMLNYRMAGNTSNPAYSAKNIPDVEKIGEEPSVGKFSCGSNQALRSLLNNQQSKLYTADITSKPTSAAKNIPSAEKIVQKDGTGEDLRSLKYKTKLYPADITSEPTSAAKNISSAGKILQKDGTGQGSLIIENSRSERRKSSGKKSSAFTLERSTLTFKDVGGLDQILSHLRKLFFPLRESEACKHIGLLPPGGILLHGPPGCGKTHLARAISGELGLPYIEVSAKELSSEDSGSSIRDLFAEAFRRAPCFLFLDKIDVICHNKKDKFELRFDRRMFEQLLKYLDALQKLDISKRVMVIGITNSLDSIDPALRLNNRFEIEFSIEMPDENVRLKILQVLCRKFNFAPEFDMQWLAHNTPGYLGADLQSLIKQAGFILIERICKKLIDKNTEAEGLHSIADSLLSKFNSSNNENILDPVNMWFKSKLKIPEEEYANIYFELQDFQAALRCYVPFIKREGFVTAPVVTWNDVGALESIKKEIQKAILWPVKYRKVFENGGRKSTKGIILYGPKGCGKTLLAKAIANESSLNFISVKGAELLTMYVGESERAVRDCFQRARYSAPCVIFFDEVDALCRERSVSNTNFAADRVVAQMLTEMDGFDELKQVFVIGATNKLENIDSALLRSGRFGKCIYVGLPSPNDRIEILKSLTKNGTQPKLADDVDLQQICFDSRCENFSGADMKQLVDNAFDEAVEDCINSSHFAPDGIVEVNMMHFQRALSILKPSVAEKERKYYEHQQICV